MQHALAADTIILATITCSPTELLHVSLIIIYVYTLCIIWLWPAYLYRGVQRLASKSCVGDGVVHVEPARVKKASRSSTLTTVRC